MIDNYTKAVLTVIAITLSLITIKLFEPKPAQAAMLGGPTFGDFLDLRKVEDVEKRKVAYANFMRSLPMVRVQGGSIDADIN